MTLDFYLLNNSLGLTGPQTEAPAGPQAAVIASHFSSERGREGVGEELRRETDRAAHVWTGSSKPGSSLEPFVF